MWMMRYQKVFEIADNKQCWKPVMITVGETERSLGNKLYEHKCEASLVESTHERCKLQNTPMTIRISRSKGGCSLPPPTRRSLSVIQLQGVNHVTQPVATSSATTKPISAEEVFQGSCTFCEIKFHDFSKENQWDSMTFSYQRKVKIFPRIGESSCTYKYYLNCH